MKDCEIIRDLMPLYAEGLASEKTVELVQEHLDQCPACRALLAQMKVQTPYSPAENDSFRTGLRRLKRRASRRTVTAAVLVLVLALAFGGLFLWSKGVFCLAERVTSPNGAVTTTAYSQNVSGLFPTDEGFTLRDEGAWQGTTNYLDGTFDGLWWSADSNYQVVSMWVGEERRLVLHDYVRNVASNLDSRLDAGIYDLEEFVAVPYDDELNRAIEYRFLQWSAYDSNMLIYFSYLDADGIDRDGYFWYDYYTGKVSGVMELENAAVDGTLKEQGRDFWVMDLDILDENGNVLEFVFTVSAATALRNTQALQPGDHVRVVCRGASEYQACPWELNFGTGQGTHPAAISVTVLD